MFLHKRIIYLSTVFCPAGNTIEAMQAAHDIGVASAEFDAQMTKDGEIVLFRIFTPV